MDRLTKRFTDGGAYCEEIIDVGIKGVNYPTYVGRAVDKLAEYEDLEEQGKLIALPCAVGDTVYCIMTSIKRTNPMIFSQKFDYSMIECFGKSVFLTKEQAEEALKGSGENET